MPDLTPRQEAFCQAYAVLPSGAAAARDAGYAPSNAAHRAAKLLASAVVMERLAELRGTQAARRAEDSRALIDKLEPLYDASLEAGDHDRVLQVVELQARIAGLVHGGATVRARMERMAGGGGSGHEAALDALDAPDTQGAKATQGQ